MRKFTCAFLLVSSITVGTFGIACAHTGYLEEFNDKYGTRATSLDSCSTCHEVILRLNPYGEDFRDNGFSFDAIEQMDSDNDGFSNIAEIVDRTFPGDQVNVPPSGGEDTGCFIATAASGSPLEPYVKVLQEYLNRFLVPNKGHKAFLELPHKRPPPIALFMAKDANYATLTSLRKLRSSLGGSMLLPAKLQETSPIYRSPRESIAMPWGAQN